MKLIVAALLGVALATSSLPIGRPLSAKYEYRFRYEGALVSGIPLSTEAAITRIQSDVLVQIPDDRTAFIRLSNVRLAASNDDVERSFEHLQKRDIAEEHKRLLELPVQFNYRNGMVSELQFVEDEQAWSSNIKRAVINMLQINLEKTVEDGSEQDSDNFVVSEKTVEGECKVAYTVVADKEETTVTKSVDFERCTTRKNLRYNVRYLTECKDCVAPTEPIVPSTVYTYKFKEQNLNQVDVLSTYTVFLKDQSTMKTEVRAKLELVDSEKIRSELEVPRGEKQDLFYSTEWEELVEKFYKNGDEVMPFERQVEKFEQVQKILTALSEMKEHEPESVHLLARLVELFRMSTMDELKKIHDHLYRNAETKQMSIIDHALAIAGTKNTVEHLIYDIQKKHISPIKAAQLMKSIQETSFPSEKIADLLHELAISDLCRREPALRQATLLAFGSVVRGVVSPNQEKHLIVEVSKELKQKYVSIIRSLFERADSVYEKVLALKTFANAAIDISISELEKIIYNKKEHTTVRMEAIDALRLLCRVMPRKVQRVLLPVFMDRSEKSEIRMSALIRLFYSRPPKSVIGQIVNTMERESNRQIADFTYQVIKGVSESNHPCYKELVAECAVAIRMTSFVPSDKSGNTFKLLPFYIRKWLSGGNIEIATVMDKSALPRDIMINLEALLSGDLSHYLGQIGLTQQSGEVLVSKILKKLNIWEQKTTHRGLRNSAVSYIKELAQKMNIREREVESSEPIALIYLRYKQMDYAVWPIDEKIIDNVLEQYFSNGRLDLNNLQMNSDFDFTHVAYFLDTKYTLPTTLGLPLTVSAKLPTIMTAAGRFELDGFNLRLRTQPTIASTHVYEIRVATPLFENGMKMLRSAKVNTPVDLSVELLLKSKPELKLTMKPIETETSILRFSSRPVLFTRWPKINHLYKYVEAEEKTIVLPVYEKFSRPMTYTKEILGSEFKLVGIHYNEWTFEQLLFGEQDIELLARPTERLPKEIVTRMTVGWEKDVSIEQPSVNKMLSDDLSVEESEWELEDREPRRREHARRYAREMVRGSRASVLITVESSEKSTVEMIAACGNDLRFCRLSFEARLPENRSRDFTIKHKAEILLPQHISSLKQLRELPHREIQMYLSSVWGLNDENRMDVNMMLEQNKEQNKLINLWSNREVRGMDETKILRKAGMLNQLKAVVDYKLTLESQLFFERIYDLVKSYSWIHTTVMPAMEQEGKLRVLLEASPITEALENITIVTPREKSVISNIRFPVRLPTLSRLQTTKALREMVVGNSECKVESNKIRTFDDVIYRAPLTTCFSVIAKDCSSEHKFVVSARKSFKRGDEKMVKINKDGNQYDLKINDGKIQVRVNNELLDKRDYERYNVEMVNERLCVVDLDDLIVRFDGYTIKTELSGEYKEKQCGLCGHYDDEKNNDFRTADDYETEDLEMFHRSFLVKDDECQMEESRLSEKKQYKLFNDDFDAESSEEDSFMDSEYKRDYTDKEETKPEKVNLINEYNHRICVSLDVVAQCQKRRIPTRTTEKKVKFACFSRSKAETRQLINELREEPRRLEREYESDFSKFVFVPVACEAY